MTTGSPMNTSTRRKQKRNFALIWTALTIIIGVASFVAIFWATGLLLPDVTTPAVVNAAVITTATPMPTTIPATTVQQIAVMPTATTVVPTAVAQEPTATTEPTPEPTLSAMENTAFDFGIQVQESIDLYDYWAEVAQNQLHVDWVKQQIRWEDFEHTQGEYDWTVTDIVVENSAAKGNILMLSIVTAPEWAREPGADLTKHGPPANNQDYTNFVTALLNRYVDEYPGVIGAIEVWNEMNIDREWSSVNGLDTASYVSLLADTHDAVKAIDPGIIIISGALSPTGWNDGIAAYDDFVYLDMLIADGLLNYTDCVGAHHNGYNIGPTVAWDETATDPNNATASFRGPFDNPHHSWSMYSTLSTYANKIQLAGGDQRLCVTEFGWAVSEDLDGVREGFEFANDNTLQEQADYIIEAVQWFEESEIVWLAWVWNLNYGVQAGFASDNDNVPYSILRPEGPAPAWSAIAEYRMEHFSEE